MHEFHAWIVLAESTVEDDSVGMQRSMDKLRDLVEGVAWHDAVFEINNLNGQYFFRADGMVNRRRAEGKHLDDILTMIAHELPGSWGLVYERDDEMPDPPGVNAFRVRKVARGMISEEVDTFLSPCNPVIED